MVTIMSDYINSNIDRNVWWDI